MIIEAIKLAAEFNRYFTSANGVDVPAKVSVSRDEWRALFTAIQQAEAQQPATTDPVYWEWRHLSTHPDTVDFGQWSKWERVEARSAIHTIDDALAEFRAYIAQGYKYELRALYDHPAPSVPDGYVLVKTEVVVRLVSLIGPTPVEHDGKTFTFDVPNPEENLRLISATVRSMLAAKAQKGQG